VSDGFWSAGSNASYSQIIRLTDAVTNGDTTKGKVLKTDASTGNVTVTDVTIGTAFVAVSTASTSQKAATIYQVAESIKRWGGSYVTVDGTVGSPTGNSIAGARYVETVAPTSGQGSNGDLWFVREP
jgi:hypothetical protein